MSPHAKLFFDLHQNEHMGGTQEWFHIKTAHSDMEATGNLEIDECALLETNECLECAMAMAHLILLLLNLRNTNALCSAKINDREKQRS